MTIAVVIHKRAARAPIFSSSRDAGFRADIRESAVSIIVVENIFAVVSHVEIIPAVVVVIAHADALPPTRRREAGLHRHIRESAVVIVVIEMIRGACAGRKSFESSTIHDENIRPAIVVVIEDRDSRSRRLNDEFLGIHASKNNFHRETSLFGDVHEVCKLARASLSLRAEAKRERKQQNQCEPESCG